MILLTLIQAQNQMFLPIFFMKMTTRALKSTNITLINTVISHNHMTYWDVCIDRTFREGFFFHHISNSDSFDKMDLQLWMDCRVWFFRVVNHSEEPAPSHQEEAAAWKTAASLR